MRAHLLGASCREMRDRAVKSVTLLHSYDFRASRRRVRAGRWRRDQVADSPVLFGEGFRNECQEDDRKMRLSTPADRHGAPRRVEAGQAKWRIGQILPCGVVVDRRPVVREAGGYNEPGSASDCLERGIVEPAERFCWQSESGRLLFGCWLLFLHGPLLSCQCYPMPSSVSS